MPLLEIIFSNKFLLRSGHGQSFLKFVRIRGFLTLNLTFWMVTVLQSLKTFFRVSSAFIVFLGGFLLVILLHFLSVPFRTSFIVISIFMFYCSKWAIAYLQWKFKYIDNCVYIKFWNHPVNVCVFFSNNIWTCILVYHIW